MCSDSRKSALDPRYAGCRERWGYCWGVLWSLNLEAAVAQRYPASTPAPARLVSCVLCCCFLRWKKHYEVKLVSFKHASRNRASNQNDAIVDCPRPPLVKAVKETPQVLNSRGCVILFAGLISSGSLERSSERVSRAPAYQRTEKGVSVRVL